MKRAERVGESEEPCGVPDDGKKEVEVYPLKAR